MGATKNFKERAITLRKQGLSYNEIRKQIPVSKSSLSLWLRDVRLAPHHRDRLYTKKITYLTYGAQSQRERRKREVDELIEGAKHQIAHPLSPDTFRLFGAALYWAEGSKKRNFDITNSDPFLIAFMVRWFETMFGVLPCKLKAHLNIYPQQDEHDLKRFWSDVTGIPLERFGKTVVKSASKGFKKNTLYYGTIKVYVPCGTDMRYRTLGWIQGALQGLVLEIESTKLRWSQLQTKRPPANLRP